jgi:hypothetical protein
MEGRPDVNPTQGFHPTDRQRTWETEEAYWRDNWQSRPYVTADRTFDYYQPAYRYGVESAVQFRDLDWKEAEEDLSVGWSGFDYPGSRPLWEDVRHAVKDSWHRVRATK